MVEDVNGTPLFLPVIVDVFGADHSQRYQVAAPNPAFGAHVGLRAWKVSRIGPVVVSERTFADV